LFVRDVTADDRGTSRSLARRTLAIRLIILRVMMKMIAPIENAASKYPSSNTVPVLMASAASSSVAAMILT
jgi:hypothetical protein